MTTESQDVTPAGQPSPTVFVPTGVAGLDTILVGGLMRGGFYLLQGDPGSGKTTVALQFARACTERGESILYITLSESRADLERTARSHDWSLDGITLFDMSVAENDPETLTQTPLFHPAEVELGETTRRILAEVERLTPMYVVFDGLGELRMLAGDAFTYRRQMLALKRYFEAAGATVLLLDDRTGRFGEAQPETLVGGNIVLERYVPGYGGIHRRLQVTKVRGGDFRTGYHDYAIQRGGIVVFPRLTAPTSLSSDFERTVFSSGLENLDQMAGGGLAGGTTTLILGPAGVGKSTVTMKYVATALAAGQRAAVYTFDEILDTFFERSERLCAAPIRSYAATGQLHAQQVNPAELSPGAFSHEVRRAVDAGARMVVIDSLNGYLSAMPEERFLQTHLHELFAYLDHKGVATIVIVALHGLLTTELSQIDVSYLADTVLLLRYFEANGEIHQAISTFKKRTGPHERTLRQLQISSEGLSVGEPLRGFRGIMTGIPQYEANATRE